MQRWGTGAPGLAAAVLLAALFATILPGCRTAGPDFVRPGTPPALAGWSGGSLAPLAAEVQARPGTDARQGRYSREWWRSFNDPVLDALIAEAQRANPTVRIAGLRIMEARAQLGVAGSGLYPQVQQATGELVRAGSRRAGGPDSSLTSLDLGMRISWELDFWGKFKRSIEAADAGYLASIFQYDDVQVLMAAQVAGLYSTIRTLEVRLAIAAQNAALLRRSLDITEGLFKGGIESELDVQQARTLYLGTLATIPQFEASLRQAQNALGTLLGRAPGPLPEMTAGVKAVRDPYHDPIPNARLELIVDLPGEMLRRRPDVRAVEMQMAAQSALIGVSAADLYPSISLLGSLGLAATSASGAPKVLDWAFGSGMVWNVFDHGRLTNTVLLQDARFQQLYEQYQDAVLRAAREVDDAAAGFARTGEQIVLLADSVEAARRALDLATLQYREGLTDFQRVIDSQRVFFSQQDLLVTSRGNLAQSLVALYKAMGGGWEGGRTRPVLDEATRATMQRRSDWKGLLDAPLPGAPLPAPLPEAGHTPMTPLPRTEKP
jgi:multidrug efflux system outer membrane protein